MPEVPAVPGAPAPLTGAVDEVFSERGPLARGVDDYEPRDGQRRLAAAIAAAVEHGGTLLAEAGTGTGKTLAYLVPAVLSRQRVLVSTGTKNLQEQIFDKDLPALRRALGIPFTATVMKGRSNYLCRHRLESLDEEDSPRLIDEPASLLPLIRRWASRTQTGDRAELAELPEDVPFWSQVAASAETCLGTECRHYTGCFVTLMRQRAAESDVVIVNHHLLCADAAVRQGEWGEVVPAAPVLVIDEAHQLEDVATQYFGIACSSHRVDELVRDAERLPASPPELTQAVERVAQRARAFFAAIGSARGEPADQDAGPRSRYTADTMGPQADEGLMLAGALDGLAATLALMPSAAVRTEGADRPPVPAEVAAGLKRRAEAIAQDLRFLVRADDRDFVYYLESRGTGGAPVLRASPVDVSRLVRDAVFDRFRTVVLTSATLSVDGSFAYVKGRLGVPGADSLLVPSEFDYWRQALLYLPRRMPSPRSPAFAAHVAREAIELVKRSKGRAFVLFTSYAVLRTVQAIVEMAVPYPILVQGTAPRSALIERFRSTPNAVLLATSSFWQGVDVAGEALSCVIIDKLPFASPADPVTAARIDAVRAAGGDGFVDLQVPLAILALKQGLGRLLRRRTDRGVLAVLDPRLQTTGYGRRFLASLPPAPVTHDLDAVERFFQVD